MKILCSDVQYSKEENEQVYEIHDPLWKNVVLFNLPFTFITNFICFHLNIGLFSIVYFSLLAILPVATLVLLQ